MSRTAHGNSSSTDHPETGRLFLAATAHMARNMEAFVDMVAAAVGGLSDTHAHLVSSGADAWRDQIAGAADLLSAKSPEDFFQAQDAYGRRAADTYAANARTLGALLMAGAKATSEPLLERLC